LLLHHKILSQRNQIAGWDIHIASEATRRDWPLYILPCTPETAGTVVAPVEDENSLSSSTDAHVIRDHIYQTYRVAGWKPASLKAAEQQQATPVPTTVDTQAVDTQAVAAPAPAASGASSAGDGDGETADGEG
jgi:hypothetical protein